jgi:hypothetical protein
MNDELLEVEQAVLDNMKARLLGEKKGVKVLVHDWSDDSLHFVTVKDETNV